MGGAGLAVRKTVGVLLKRYWLNLPDLHRRHGLIAAIVIDSLGTGLFVPFAVIYATMVARISLSLTGQILSLATAMALLVAPIAGILSDHWGARRLVVTGDLLQATGFAGYLLISQPWQLFVCALCVAAGNQMFWAANGAFLAQVGQPAERDRWFALQGACRSAGLGGGAALAGTVVAAAGVVGYSWLAALNALSFVVAAALIARVKLDGLEREQAPDEPQAGLESRSRHSITFQDARVYRLVLEDLPFLGFTATNVAFSLIVLSSTLALPIYIVGVLRQPAWVVGVLFSMNAALVALAQMAVVRWTERYRRTRALAFAAGLFGMSFLTLASLSYLPKALPTSRGWALVGLIAAVGVYTLAELVMAPLKNALVADAAPDALRGRYMAFYHLSWSVASAGAPMLLMGLLAEGPLWLWLALAAVSYLALLALVRLDALLPERATRPRSQAGVE
ncbi:MAG TPA: MFS transporter [Ktedonobacterales bacterium]|nr:MFS transporter [Ktedonobacterales bacterium]